MAKTEILRVSVALCTYNGGKYIRKQLESILSQIYLPDEIIVCDDCSVDDTLAIIKSISEKTTLNIHIYENETTLNVLGNFEKAISQCTGDLIFLCDQDDIWERNKVSEIVKYFTNHTEINVLFSNAKLVNESGELYPKKYLFDVVNFTSNAQKHFNNGFGFELFNIENRATGATMAFRKYYIEKIIPFNRKVAILHDEIIAINAINDCCLGYLTDPLTQYRIHENQKNGLGNWFQTPPDINVYSCKNVKVDYTKCVEFSGKFLNKLLFIRKRDFLIKSFFGFFLIVLNVKGYKDIYSNKAFRVLRCDMIDFLRMNLRRIKNTIHA